MADTSSKFANAVSALFDGMETFAKSKTVVGEPIVMDDMTLIPLVDISIGMGANSALSAEKKKNSEFGGVGAKLSPTAILLIKDGSTRVIDIKNQTTAMKLMDLIPEVVNRFAGKTKIKDPEAAKVVQDIKDAVNEADAGEAK